MMKRKVTAVIVSALLAIVCLGVFGCGSKDSVPEKSVSTVSEKSVNTVSVKEQHVIAVGYINRPNVYSFKSPTVSSEIVENLSEEEQVSIIEIYKEDGKNTWYLIKSGRGKVGFVRCDYINGSKPNVFSHNIIGLDSQKTEEAKQIIRETERYMRKHYQVELDRELTIIHTNDFFGEMKRIYGTYDKERDSNILGRSFGGRYLIVINMKDTKPQYYKNILIHELAHQFQYMKLKKDKLDNLHHGYFEGAAEWISQDMTKREYHVPKDYGISIKKFETEEDFEKARKKYGYSKVYSQNLFFVKQIAKTKRPSLVASLAELL